MNESKPDTQESCGNLSAANFILPEGVHFYVGSVSVEDCEIEVVIDIADGVCRYWQHGSLANGDQIVLSVPTQWEICGECRGEGKRLMDGFHGVAFTQEDRRDWSPDDEDDYFSGAMDVPCTDCSGTGKVRVLDLSGLSETFRQSVDAWHEEESYYDQERAQERAMGC